MWLLLVTGENSLLFYVNAWLLTMKYVCFKYTTKALVISIKYKKCPIFHSELSAKINIDLN